MRSVVVLVLFALVSGFLPQRVALAHTVTVEEYKFPFQDPWIASICSAAVMYRGDVFEKIELEVLPERRTVKFLEDRNKVVIGLFQQKGKTAPLVFVLSGTGGSALSPGALTAGQQMFDLGYHVVTLPSTMNFQYAIGVSRTGAPGYIPNDSKEFYEFLKIVTRHLKEQNGLQISGFSIVGYSLGGLVAGFLVQKDNHEKFFNFDKLVMINPAVDIGYAMNVLDEAYAAGQYVSKERRDFISAYVFKVGYEMLEQGFNLNNLLDSVKYLNLSMNERRWLVGSSFRDDLRYVVFYSQQVNDLNVLKEQIGRYKMNARIAESRTVSFDRYMREIVFPSLKTDVPLKALVQNSNMFALKGLKNNKNVYIFANQDDYIHRPEDIQFMNEFVGDDRFYLYPNGGHVGNLWYPKNKADLDAVMKL